MRKNISKNANGFTLIELLVVTTLLGIISTGIAQIFFTILKGGAKAEILKEAKQNGDYALSIMERMVRNASAVDCASAPDSIEITNPDFNTTTFSLTGGKIASSSASNNGFLTGGTVFVSGLTFGCIQSSGGIPSVVTISFTVSQPPKSGVTPNPKETASVFFKTTVSLRTY